MSRRSMTYSTFMCIVVIFTAIIVLQQPTTADDVVEFLNGSKQTGVVKEIRQEDKEFDFEVVIAGKKFTRTYAFSKVHAVTMNMKRYLVTPKSSTPAKPKPSSPTNGQLTRQAVTALIADSAIVIETGEGKEDRLMTGSYLELHSLPQKN